MKHPPAPLRVTPPLLREGARTQWPGKAGSTGALNKYRSRRVASTCLVALRALGQSEVSQTQGTAEPALPGRQCRPLGGDAEGGAGGGHPDGR
jgi:hypothetical protein